ncbi:hypothetical protein POSPLADRAFT_1075735 [Postia placenta MAD-698-R-SB12]|uniref:Uncharacterized protein n=1 Tax=Postia placenta MAD-698-R-SB12 TaxID=670580 RepID=A0A1X6MR94_9APHY|nr:hypothetical protein POSPLADRAFT_1075735 [Postia placenta MAD-698-R-SB12]OSX58809.1 hypothetical protein POSPLADRAFT_1075735 [Postia placenta MAD-698-R-SB12]
MPPNWPQCLRVDAYLAGATQHLDLRISGAQYPLREGAPNMNGRWLSYSCPASAVVVRAHPVYALFRVFHPSYPVIGSRTVLCAGGLSRDLISSFVWVESAALLSAPPPERSTLSLQPALTRREPLSISGVRYPLRTEAPSMSGRRSTVGGSRIAVRPPLWYASMLRMRPPGSPVGDSCTALCAGGLSRDLVSCFVLMWRVQPTFDPRPPPPRPPRLRQVRAGSVPSGAGSAALLVGSVSDGRVSMDGIPAPFVRADRGISERPCARAGPYSFASGARVEATRTLAARQASERSPLRVAARTDTVATLGAKTRANDASPGHRLPLAGFLYVAGCPTLCDVRRSRSTFTVVEHALRVPQSGEGPCSATHPASVCLCARPRLSLCATPPAFVLDPMAPVTTHKINIAKLLAKVHGTRAPTMEERGMAVLADHYRLLGLIRRGLIAAYKEERRNCFLAPEAEAARVDWAAAVRVHPFAFAFGAPDEDEDEDDDARPRRHSLWGVVPVPREAPAGAVGEDLSACFPSPPLESIFGAF